MKIKLTILKYLSYIWDYIHRMRRIAYNNGFLKSSRVLTPIISVGNLSFGGTGKTPFVIWLTEYFNSLDKKIMILTRGYKGSLEKKGGAIVVDNKVDKKINFSTKEKYNPSLFGDEPILLANKINKGCVLVGADRVNNLKKFFDTIDPDIILLDDGFQHLKLQRDLDIVLIDASMPLSLYHPFPYGKLRENINVLKNADVVVINKTEQIDSKTLSSLNDKLKTFTKSDAIFAHIKYKITGFYNSFNHRIYLANELEGKKVVAMAGLAAPDSFFNSLTELGASIVDKIVLPDHFQYNKKYLDETLLKLLNSDRILVTTEKDMVKIREIVVNDSLLFAAIKIEFVRGEEQLKSLIKKIMN
ncbi:MAG: tetraacyldisaccharide 4'-kinase [Oligoflexia bacterium]|nr:tetraacyldisaccharide 4'-kinase [Oligoflexia bacterium]